MGKIGEMKKNFGIPTSYRGTRFRSRLEARWAVFFDLIGWKWEYEPLDLDGYIPDFILTNTAEPILVEVKPAMTKEEMLPAATKVDESGWEGEAMVVGARLLEGDYRDGMSHAPLFGLFKDLSWYPKWEDGYLVRCSCDKGIGLECPNHKAPCGRITPMSIAQSWDCRLCNLWGKHYSLETKDFLSNAWIVAGNSVQWKRKSS